MSTQTKMFEHKHPGAAAKPRKGQPVPEQKQGAEETRDAAYRRLQQRAGHMSQLHKSYLALLKQFAGGYHTNDGVTLRGLTDAEAAAWMEVGRSTINGRRNELCGGYGSSEQIQKQPLVVKGRKRLCQINGTKVQAWKLAPSLFD